MTPYEQGLAHYQTGDYQAGLACFTEAINHGYQPLDAAYDERSKCYEALGQLDAAKADLAHMLTLPIDEARRKQITDLMALLDHAEIKPLSPPDKISKGIKVEESETELTIRLAASSVYAELVPKLILLYIVGSLLFVPIAFLTVATGGAAAVILVPIIFYLAYYAMRGKRNETIIQVNAQGLKLTVAPMPSRKFTPIELPRAELEQFLCQREIGTARDDTASYILQVVKPLTAAPSSSTANLVQLLKLNNYEQIRYIQWKLRSHLNLPDIELPQEYRHAHPVQAYDYKPLRQLSKDDIKPYESFLVFFSVLAIPFFLITLSMAMSENPHPNIFETIGWAIVGLIYILVAVVMSIISLNPIAMRQAQQIVDKGRLTLGVVSFKNHRTWHQSKGGTQHVFDVYYRYYGYEAKFNSVDAFHQFNVGSPIKVAYLPDKPHLSKPYYAFPQPGKWLISRIAEQIALLPTQGRAFKWLFLLCLVNLTVGHTLGAGLGLIAWYLEQNNMPVYAGYLAMLSACIVYVSAYIAMLTVSFRVTPRPFGDTGFRIMMMLNTILSLSGMYTFAVIFLDLW